MSTLSRRAQENWFHGVNLGLTFPKAGWGCCAHSTCGSAGACSALTQNHFLIAASARLPAEPKESPVLGWVPQHSAQRQHPTGPAGSSASSWRLLGPLTQLKAVSGQSGLSSSRKEISPHIPWTFNVLEARPST